MDFHCVPPITTQVFAKHASHGLMDHDDWDRWLISLGLPNAYIRARLFETIDRSNDRFIDFEEFSLGLAQVAGGGKERLDLAFHMFDLDGNGVVSEKELREFLQQFFSGLIGDVEASLRVLEELLSPENESVRAVSVAARDATAALIGSYCDAVVTNAYQASGVSAARQQQQQQQQQQQEEEEGGTVEGHQAEAAVAAAGDDSEGFYISELGRWYRENDDQFFTFLDCLVEAILDELDSFGGPAGSSMAVKSVASVKRYPHLLEADAVQLGLHKKTAASMPDVVSVAESTEANGREQAQLLLRKGEQRYKLGGLDAAQVALECGLGQPGLGENLELAKALKELLKEVQGKVTERNAALATEMLKQLKEGTSSIATKVPKQTKVAKDAPQVPAPRLSRCPPLLLVYRALLHPAVRLTCCRCRLRPRYLVVPSCSGYRRALWRFRRMVSWALLSGYGVCAIWGWRTNSSRCDYSKCSTRPETC